MFVLVLHLYLDQVLQHDEQVELEGNVRTCEGGPSSEPENEDSRNEVDLEFILLSIMTYM